MENDDLVWLVGKIQYWRVMNPVYCRYFPAQSGRIISILILIIALLFNLPQFFELKTVVLNSVNDTTNIIARPTKLRFAR